MTDSIVVYMYVFLSTTNDPPTYLSKAKFELMMTQFSSIGSRIFRNVWDAPCQQPSHQGHLIIANYLNEASYWVISSIQFVMWQVETLQLRALTNCCCPLHHQIPACRRRVTEAARRPRVALLVSFRPMVNIIEKYIWAPEVFSWARWWNNTVTAKCFGVKEGTILLIDKIVYRQKSNIALNTDLFLPGELLAS